MTDERTSPGEPEVGGLEVITLLGMALVAVGVWLSLGVGPALVASGAMMLATALVVAVSRARAGRT